MLSYTLHHPPKEAGEAWDEASRWQLQHKQKDMFLHPVFSKTVEPFANSRLQMLKLTRI